MSLHFASGDQVPAFAGPGCFAQQAYAMCACSVCTCYNEALPALMVTGVHEGSVHAVCILLLLFLHPFTCVVAVLQLLLELLVKNNGCKG